MTPEEIRDRVQMIRHIREDIRTAHREEDQLHADVLFAIAEGAPNPGILAREALATDDIQFFRWFD